MSSDETFHKDTPFLWAAELARETRTLDALTRAAATTRRCAVSGGSRELEELLATQANLCEELQAFKERREQQLRQRGYPNKDLLVAALDQSAAGEHASVTAVFSDYVAAAEAAQREIDINREFFGVALSTLQDALEAVSPSSTTYGRGRSAVPDPLLFSANA